METDIDIGLASLMLWYMPENPVTACMISKTVF